MVYLFGRPILPFYNKGKNLSFVVIIFHQIYFNKATASLSLCKLREGRELPSFAESATARAVVR